MQKRAARQKVESLNSVQKCVIRKAETYYKRALPLRNSKESLDRNVCCGHRSHVDPRDSIPFQKEVQHTWGHRQQIVSVHIVYAGISETQNEVMLAFNLAFEGRHFVLFPALLPLFSLSVAYKDSFSYKHLEYMNIWNFFGSAT